MSSAPVRGLSGLRNGKRIAWRARAPHGSTDGSFMFDLSGRTALVTGASGGIGHAIARSLAGQGARLGLSGTRQDVLERLAAEIGGGACALPADLASPGGADGLIEAAAASLGGVDILVHNAGLTRDGLAVRMSDDDWAKVIDVNLAAGFRLIRGALRGMMKKRWGRIIAITSVVAATGNAGQANYVASKAGLTGMIKALAQEVAGRGITANCVAPGFIETDMTAGLPDARRAAVLASIPAGRFGSADDVAPCVSFLASAEAGYVTGQTVHVNGGMAMIS
jgi:3-oxoacyl-[acyl-carrier-protein] reductase (EC 1.1.1.100)